MEKIQLTTCCGRYSLKTGTISIGVSNIVLTLISMIIIFTTNEELDGESTKGDAQDKTPINVIFTVSNCINILTSALLIIGALKKNTCMMLPWLIVQIIATVGFTLYILFVTIMTFGNGDVFLGILALVVGLIFIMIFTYLGLVVYSYLTELRIEEMNNRMGPL